MATLNPTDLFDVRSLLTEEEQMIQDTVARFVDERALPLMADAFDKAVFPMELIPEMADLGLLGSRSVVIPVCVVSHRFNPACVCTRFMLTVLKNRNSDGCRIWQQVRS